MKKNIGFALILFILGLIAFPGQISAFSFSATNFSGTFAYDVTGGDIGNLDPRFSYEYTESNFNTFLTGSFDFTYIPSYPDIDDIRQNPATDWKWTVGLSDLTLPWQNTALPSMKISHVASFNDIMTGVNWAQALYDEYVPIEVCYTFDYSFTGPTGGHADFYLGTNLDAQWLPECLPDYYYGEFQSDARVDITADPIPEPISLVLFGAGLAGVRLYRRKKSK